MNHQQYHSSNIEIEADIDKFIKKYTNYILKYNKMTGNKKITLKFIQSREKVIKDIFKLIQTMN
tara:strand:+ start:22205 stop:22396 length:192 start_codon:yes stop_codon:yes gene_type:complete